MLVFPYETTNRPYIFKRLIGEHTGISQIYLPFKSYIVWYLLLVNQDLLKKKLPELRGTPPKKNGWGLDPEKSYSPLL